MIKKLLSLVSISLSSLALVFAYQTLATHLMEPVDFGYFSKWLTDIGLFGAFFTIGLDVSIVYFTKKGQLFRKNVMRNVLIYLIVSFFLLLFIYVFLDEYYSYFILIVTLFFLSVFSVFLSYFQYVENFKVYGRLILTRSLLIFFPMLLFAVFDRGLAFELAISLYLTSVFLSFLIVFFVYIKNNKISCPDVLFERDYFLYGIRSIINKSLGLILYSSSIYCVFYFLGPENAAYFFVATAISKLMWVIPDSAGNILYPKFIKAKAENFQLFAEKDMYFYAQLILLANLAFLILFYLLGNTLFEIIYDDSYSKSYLPTLILLFGNQGMVYYKILSRYFISINDWKPMRVSLIVAILFNIITNFIFLEHYGLVGAAIITSLSFWLCGILMTFYYKRAFIQFLNIFSCFKNLRLNNL